MRIFFDYLKINFQSNFYFLLLLIFSIKIDTQHKIEIYNNIFSILHSKYEIFTKRKLLRGNTITSTNSSTPSRSGMGKSMSFSALLAKSDSNENILVDVNDTKEPDTYILIDSDLDKQNEVEVDSATSLGAEINNGQQASAVNTKTPLPPMNQVRIFDFY
jgi:hypothetical protein